MRDAEGRLLRTYAGGQAKLPAYLDDYAFLVDGLIALHRATGDERWLEAAGELTEPATRAVLGRARGRILLHLDAARAADRPQQAADRQRHALGQFGRRRPTCCTWPSALDKPEYVERAEQCIRVGGVRCWKSIPRPCRNWPWRWPPGSTSRQPPRRSEAAPKQPQTAK